MGEATEEVGEQAMYCTKSKRAGLTMATPSFSGPGCRSAEGTGTQNRMDQ